MDVSEEIPTHTYPVARKGHLSPSKGLDHCASQLALAFGGTHVVEVKNGLKVEARGVESRKPKRNGGFAASRTTRIGIDYRKVKIALTGCVDR
jgi:hypothetical protein